LDDIKSWIEHRDKERKEAFWSRANLIYRDLETDILETVSPLNRYHEIIKTLGLSRAEKELDLVETQVREQREQNEELKRKTSDLMSRARRVFTRLDIDCDGVISRDDVISIQLSSKALFPDDVRTRNLQEWNEAMGYVIDSDGLDNTESMIAEIETLLNKSQRLKRRTKHREQEKAKERAKSQLAKKRFQRERAESVRVITCRSRSL
jgi:hypothetical protein